ncbi:hypothetical protein PENTCL1PPCAC_15300, partial [Pristionchus entomophagus]
QVPRMITLLVLLASFLHSGSACAATSPGTTTPSPAACTTCAQNLITKTTNGMGSHTFATDTTTTTGACNMRTFTCVGPNANIEINDMMGTIEDGGTGTATMTVTCNAAGTAWELQGIAITSVECASGVVG